ncbi:uncharacterized protein M8220_006268 [Acridotheres tristis]
MVGNISVPGLLNRLVVFRHTKRKYKHHIECGSSDTIWGLQRHQLQSFRAARCWFMCLFTRTSLHSGWTITAQKAAEKRLLCHKHEMYSPGRSGKRLLYESHVECKKLIQGCIRHQETLRSGILLM